MRIVNGNVPRWPESILDGRIAHPVKPALGSDAGHSSEHRVRSECECEPGNLGWPGQAPGVNDGTGVIIWRALLGKRRAPGVLAQGPFAAYCRRPSPHNRVQTVQGDLQRKREGISMSACDRRSRTTMDSDHFGHDIRSFHAATCVMMGSGSLVQMVHRIADSNPSGNWTRAISASFQGLVALVQCTSPTEPMILREAGPTTAVHPRKS
ncbi:hypothetical protein EV702DRAFT_1042373 [Suillus placidus]|uniref:Uncharacterized protein n=1 Tax=Suillus placidus TaxID=48579 RepID=A0A9P7D7C3_9AGAM|nr:hypothetical protein EV702DRAFT_1042373 [Suillus placidus]